MSRSVSLGWASAVLVSITFATAEARGQACCVGASGLTPGWLANHERMLVGTQLRMSETHGTYPARGRFFQPTPGRDARVEASLFASLRILPRAQLSLFVPFVTTRRRADALVETRSAFGDITFVGRYDLVRPGESRIPGIAFLGGAVIPTGTPPDRGAPFLAADVNGTGAWEGNFGLSVEQVFGQLVLHATALFGVRASREVAGLDQTLGPRALFLGAVGWVFEGDVSLLGTVTHTSEGDATIDGEDAPGTGSRSTQAAMLVVVPISDTLRLRTSVFTDVPPLGVNRPALGGTSISLLKSWF